MNAPDGPAPTRHLVHDGKDFALAAGLGLLGVAALGVWSWGQAAGLVASATWLPLSPTETLLLLPGLVRHLGDPRAAWPANVRSALPGPVLFYTAALLPLVVVTGSALVGTRLWLRVRRRDDGFATRREISAHLSVKAVMARGSIVRPSLAGHDYGLAEIGVPLGRSVPDKVPLAVSAEDSVLVLAAPRQGKTSQVAIPWLHHWPGPALVTSIRPDILFVTAMLRGQCGPVAVMAPTGMIGWPESVSWSPHAGCRDLDKARQRAEVMVTVGRAENQDSNNAGYFAANAVNLLTLWLHAAALAGRSMRDVLRWSLNEHDDTAIGLLRDHRDASEGTAELLDALYRTPPETRSGLWTTAQTAMAPLLSPAAQATFCPEGDGIDIEALIRSRGTVYLLVAEKQAAALAPLIAAFVDELVETAKRLADASPGGRLDPPLALILDEVANIAPLPALPSLMSFAGGSGIFITAILQSRAQAEARWGAAATAMLWGAATVKLVLGGLTGGELRDLSDLAGEYDRTMTSHQRSDDGATSTTTSTQEKRTMTPEDIRTLDSDRREALVIHATTPAVRVRMTRHYEGPDRALYQGAEEKARALLQGHVEADADAAAGADAWRAA